MRQVSEKRFALLIDADNVSAKYIKPITDELSKYGTVTYKRIYGDWTLTMHNKWKEALLENSITPIQQFGYTQGKNATDSAMIIDAMDILYTNSVEGFCIVSSDSDFTRLASRIRESGLTVVGMGEKKTPTAFRKACDIFTTLELLLGDSNGKGGRNKGRQDVSPNAQNAGPAVEEIEQAVVNIITDNQNNGKSTGLGEVGSRLLKRYPDFDVRSYGTNLLSKLLDEFSSVGITKDGSSVTVELTDGKDREVPSFSTKEGSREQRDQEKDAKGGKKAKNGADGKKRKAPKERTDVKGSPSEKAAQDRPAVEEQVAKEPPSVERQSETPSVRAEKEGSPATGETVEEPVARSEGDGEDGGSRSSSGSSIEVDTDDNPEAYIRQLIAEAGPEGVALAELGKRVRAKYRAFKVRELGYSQFKNYIADLGDIQVEKRGRSMYAVLGE